MRTETIIEKLHSAEIDMAILSTPLDDPKILEVPLYYEKFVAYISPNEPLYLQDEVSTNDMQLKSSLGVGGRTLPSESGI